MSHLKGARHRAVSSIVCADVSDNADHDIQFDETTEGLLNTDHADDEPYDVSALFVGGGC